MLAAFETSAEAAALGSPRIDAPRIVLRLAAQEYDLTLTTLRWYDLREVVFDSVPYAQAIAPGDARRFVDEILAFTRYLMRTGTPPHAEEWLRVFDQYAAEDLADIVAEPNVHHSPRRFVEAGRAAGFAVDTPEGLTAWRNHALHPRPEKPALGMPHSWRPPARPLPSPPTPYAELLPSRRDPSERRAIARARKKKRKAAARARRRNR